MWRVEFTPKADKQFSKLDRPTQQSIVEYLERILERVVTSHLAGCKWRFFKLPVLTYKAYAALRLLKNRHFRSAI